MKTECSETLAYKIQMQRNYPEETLYICCAKYKYFNGINVSSEAPDLKSMEQEGFFFFFWGGGGVGGKLFFFIF
jgi:hypothetical protein